MPKVSPLQSDFSSGEFSPLLAGRVDSELYKKALARCLGYIAMLQGPITRRPGTKFVAEVKDSSKFTRLVRFEFSTTQAYIIEFGDFYVRFYKNNGQIESSPGVPYELFSPFGLADLPLLKFTQSADVLYIVTPSQGPTKLNRTGDTSWFFSGVAVDLATSTPTAETPYLPTNTTDITLTPSGATGVVTVKSGPAVSITNCVNNGVGLIRVTATAHGKATGDRVGIEAVTGTTEANGSWNVTVINANTLDLQGSAFVHAYVSGGTLHPGVFAATDNGRGIRMQEGTTWGWGHIGGVPTHAGAATVSVVETFTNTNAKTAWRLGAWSTTTGYPSSVTFHEDRLFFGGPIPQRLDGSRSGDYENFATTDLDGTVTASHAVSFTLSSNDVNVIRWLSSDEKGLLAGTVANEWAIKSASQNEAISPTSIDAKPATSYGSANIQPVRVGKATLFVQRAGRKLREMTYFFDADGFRCPDLTHLSEHISGRGITELAFQKEPQPIIWAVREDGALLGMTYERDPDSLRVGWHRHEVGGFSDAGGSIAKVESVAAIPSADGTRDELWMIVQRWVDGGVVRYVEYMTKLFETLDEQEDAFFVDCGLTLDNPVTITGITKANPAVVTAVAHGFSDGDSVLSSEVAGMTEVNDKIFTVANKTTDTFQLQGIDSSAFSTYISGGEVRKRVTAISGLDHLEGQEVDILGDGAPQNSKTVSSGAITLDTPAAVVQVGLGYVTEGQMLRIEAGAADGTALGKNRRANRVGMLLHRSLGLKVGVDFDTLDTWQFRETNTPSGAAPPLFSGIFAETLAASDSPTENQICWRQDQPLPSTILAIMPDMHTEDRG